VGVREGGSAVALACGREGDGRRAGAAAPHTRCTHDARPRQVRELDDITFSEWFLSFGGSRGSLDRMWDPIAYALGFLDCDHISARTTLTLP
jgi:uncharacterized protein with NAD-binding domain and iron-sulfur cluster